jgi:asparagine synthase (glutamine-hydrolysing)
MIGFLGCISLNGKLQTVEYDYFGHKPYLEDDYHYKSFHLRRKINPKFPDDKVFEDDEQLFVAVDGVLLNAVQLRNSYALKNNFELVKLLYNKFKEEFIKELRGDFSLILYDKLLNKLLVYTNVNTTKPIFYFYDKNLNQFFFASNSYHLHQCLKLNGVKLTLNEFAIYSITSYGYVFGNNHFTNEIKKLSGGRYLYFTEKKKLIESSYFNLSSYPQLNFTEEKYISTIDEYFTNAVKLQFDKDLEYGYRHLSALSGGLDSRMTTLTALKLGYKNLDTFTFSSKGYWDEIIAKQISKRFKINNILFQLINGDYLKDFSKSLHINGGLLSYYVTSQIIGLYDQLDFEEYGLVHTGQVGDAIIGSTLHNYSLHFKYNFAEPNYKAHYSSKLEEEIIKEYSQHPSLEISKFKNHVENFTLEGNQFNYPYTESCSPFLDKDLLDFCLRIPLKYRNNHKLYYKWIINKHPEAGDFFYEKTKKRTINKFYNKKINLYYNSIYRYYLKYLGLKEDDNKLLNFNQWKNVNSLEEWLDEIFKKNIDVIKEKPLINDIENQYKSKSFQIKLKALHTVLTYKLYFG